MLTPRAGRPASAAIGFALLTLGACGGSTPAEPRLPVAAKLAFAVQPGTAAAGATITPQLRVVVQDASGERVTTSSAVVTLALAANPGGATLSGPLTVGAVDGVAVFGDVSLDKAAAGYVLNASAPGLAQATSLPFDIVPGAPARLRFHVQPSDVLARRAMQPHVEVRFYDGWNNFVETAAGTVTLGFIVDRPRATLSGGTAEAVSGAAVLPAVSIDRIGSGYRLVATSGQLIPDTSATFDVRTEFMAISASGGVLESGHTCALNADGDAYCWGANQSGQLGTGTEAGIATAPEIVAGGLAWSVLSAGRTNTCGIADSGLVYCWGLNDAGQLGTGGPIMSVQRAPVAVAGSRTYDGLSVGDGYVCALTADGAAYCWGGNEGRFGDGNTTSSHTPVPAAAGLSLSSISAGGGHHTCAVSTTSVAYCWGVNLYGQVGDGSDDVSVLLPREVAGGLTFTAVSAGRYHTCGIASGGGAAWCWGSNEWGQLGDGSVTTEARTPVPVAGGHTFSSLRAGLLQTCGITAGGEAWCWGRNIFGQLGTGSDAPDLHRTPVRVQAGHPFSAVSTADDHTCALTTGQVAYCWGRNHYGQLGDGSTAVRLVPVRVAH